MPGMASRISGPASGAAGLDMAFKLIEPAQTRWRAVNAPHLVALVRRGAVFKNGKLAEQPGDQPHPQPLKTMIGGGDVTQDQRRWPGEHRAHKMHPVTHDSSLLNTTICHRRKCDGAFVGQTCDFGGYGQMTNDSAVSAANRSATGSARAARCCSTE
jgi:hypothetical protein